MKIFLKTPITFFVLFFCVAICSAQIPSTVKVIDTLPSKILDSVVVNAWLKASDASYIADVEGTKIYAGKKTNTASQPKPSTGYSKKTFAVSAFIDILLKLMNAL